MANVKIQDIKTKLRTLLGELVTATTIAKVVDDTIADPLHLKVSAYPAALLTPVLIGQSQASDNRSNDRVYTVGVTLVFNNAGKANAMDTVDDTVEAVLDFLDEKLTLDGDIAPGWVEPSTTAPYGFEASKDKIAVDVVLRIHTIRALTFSGQ